MLTSAGQECSQQEISQKLSISRQTVNSAICSLIQRGYIFLERSSISTRRKNIRMTDKGEFFVRQYIIPLQDAEYRAFKNERIRSGEVCCFDANIYDEFADRNGKVFRVV